MTPFTNPANKIDLVDSDIKDMIKEKVINNPQLESESRQVSMSVWGVSLNFLGGEPTPYIGVVPIDPPYLV